MRRLRSRRLLWALAVSLLAHLLMVAETEFSLPDWSADQDHIEVTLAPPPLPKPLKNPIPEPSPPDAPKVKPRPKTVNPEQPLPVPTTPEAPPSLATASTVTEPLRMEEPLVAVSEPDTTDAAPVAIVDEPATIPSAPKRVEIEFSGFNGSKGSGKQLFELIAHE